MDYHLMLHMGDNYFNYQVIIMYAIFMKERRLMDKMKEL